MKLHAEWYNVSSESCTQSNVGILAQDVQQYTEP